MIGILRATEIKNGLKVFKKGSVSGIFKRNLLLIQKHTKLIKHLPNYESFQRESAQKLMKESKTSLTELKPANKSMRSRRGIA